MKAPGALAMELPWLPPSAAALAALTRPHSASLWTQVRHDPGCVLLLARCQTDFKQPISTSLNSLSLLETAARLLNATPVPCIDWRKPGITRIAAIAQRQAWLAAELAQRVADCDPQRAWIGGLLTPLGWFAVSAVDPVRAAEALLALSTDADGASGQRDAWGLDHTAIARRLARLWCLPAWLVPILGHLGLHVRIAGRLGAESKLFQVVQLAVALEQQRERGLVMPVGAPIDELTMALGLQSAEVEMLADQATRIGVHLPDEAIAWTPDMLAELLRLAVEQRRQRETMNGLQQDLDQLQHALEQQCNEEKERLQALKLASLAELAAGAGHEINNPLAVISGQAQYLLKQIAQAEEQLVEDPSPTLYLDSLKAKLHKALTTIVGQTQRIHHVLTDLMQFARPAAPRKQPIAAATLVHDSAAALQSAADEKKVRITFADAPADMLVRGDAAQWRTVLVNVLRNALDAAPAEGWVRVHCDIDGAGWLEIQVEDNGPGPAPAVREHLFDPFYSGRNAGRGRGLGLSTAWRLARQNGGDVRFGGVNQDATRFVLRLPVEQQVIVPANGNNHPLECVRRNGSHAGAA